MAETLVSPGVLARENDQSQITAQPIQAGAAIVGPTVKGKVNIPTLVTSFSEYQAQFGTTFISGSDEFTYFTSISAYNYFQQGGTSLLVTRVASGAFAPATSTNIDNNEVAVAGTVATGSISQALIPGAGSGGQYGFQLETVNGTSFTFVSSSTALPDFPGINVYTFTGGISGLVNEINASASSHFSASDAGTTADLFSAYSTGNGTTIKTGSFIDLIGGAGVEVGTLSGGIAGVSSNAFTLETLAEGEIQNSSGSTGANNTLVNGTSDNLRWQITAPNTSSGVFSVIIRRGDDSSLRPTVLETFANVSLDPKADNYISKVIGDMDEVVQTDSTGVSYVQPTGNFPNASRYVRVKEVIAKTPNYFDNNGDAKSEYTASIPVASEGTFEGATGTILTGTGNYYENIDSSDTQGLVEGNYDQALSILNNKDEYIYNILTAPGLNLDEHASPVQTMNSQAQSRGDYLSIIDLKGYGSTVLSAINEASAVDNSYAATYWPWVQTTDPNTGNLVWVPASTMMPGVMAYNDRVAASWFAPAGINRGGMGTVARAERKLTQSNRDELYVANVNPIGTFPNSGVVVFGQKTMQKKASALDRVNVRRLLITLKSYISQIGDTLVFEQNSVATRNSFLSQVNPYLENVQQQQGVYAFKVVMDESNNTADVIDRNELLGAIYIQPTKTAEFIYLDFNITPTGATFPA